MTKGLAWRNLLISHSVTALNIGLFIGWKLGPMYLTDEQLNEREQNNDAVYKSVEVFPLNNGKSFFKYNIEQQAHAVVLSRIIGAKKAAEVTGLVQQRITAVHAKGMTTQGGPVVQELADKVEAKSDEIRETAAALVLTSLGAIKQEEIEAANLNGKIAAADKLSAIVERMSPNSKNPLVLNGNKVQVNIFAPRVRDADEYEVVNG